MTCLNVAIGISAREENDVKQILCKYGWTPKVWGGPMTGGYEGYITLDGVRLRAHLFGGYTSLILNLQSDSPKAIELLEKTELSPYLDRTKIKAIARVKLSGTNIEQAIQQLKNHGWTGEPMYGTSWDTPELVHELPPFNIQNQEFRAQGLGPMTRDALTLTLYSAVDENKAKEALKNSDLAEILKII